VRAKIYDDLLRDVAGLVGVDPDRISLERSRVISDCVKYASPPKYQR
jgi:hypothetical protein